MNRHCPSHYTESCSETSVADTQNLISYIRSLSPRPEMSGHEPLVQPIITPRFAISCTNDLLSSLGALATSDPTIRIQTHISENPSEVSFTKELFPDNTHYAGVYDSFGLLRRNTILAHAVHLTEDEMDLIKSRDAGISHCPTSNFNLSSGIAPVGFFLDKGIKVRSSSPQKIHGLTSTLAGWVRHRCIWRVQYFYSERYPERQRCSQDVCYQCQMRPSIPSIELFFICGQTSFHCLSFISCYPWRRHCMLSGGPGRLFCPN